MTKYVTLSGRSPQDPANPVAPAPINPSTGQHEDYWVLSEAERAKGFIRTVLEVYEHTICNTRTSMEPALAETYARNPKFYTSTFCRECKDHLPVSEFRWVRDGVTTDKMVGE